MWQNNLPLFVKSYNDIDVDIDAVPNIDGVVVGVPLNDQTIPI